MSRKVLQKSVRFGATLLALSGCTGGRVLDAESGRSIPGAVVLLADGACFGKGCSTLYPATGYPYAKIDGDGIYAFDGYNDDPDRVMILANNEGDESVTLEVSAAGHRTQYIAHNVDYQEYTDADGNTKLVSLVDHVWLCPSDSPDDDADGLCNAAEQRYGTDPNNKDTDGDSLSDHAEIYGFNRVDFGSLGGSPLHKDVYVEMDYYPGLKPSEKTIQMVVDAFADAPVNNPDGKTGVHLHLHVDQEIAAEDADSDLNPLRDEYIPMINKYFTARRWQTFHYGVFTNKISGKVGRLGVSFGRPSQFFVIALGHVGGGSDYLQAHTLMHEIGHNLGLGHGGHENTNFKTNYISIMNYNYMNGLARDGQLGILDYSRLNIASLDEANLNEVAGLQAIGSTTEEDISHYHVRDSRNWLTGGTNRANANIDFNRNGSIDGASVSVDLDLAVYPTSHPNAGQPKPHAVFAYAQNDWDNLSYRSIADNILRPSMAKSGTSGTSAASIGEPIVCDTP